ncbi:hypothetical protein V8D89_011209 [Ganoderma adspersum]
MDRVPLETLQQIFQFACTDGGYTAGSLALTSKFIHGAAQSTRFHSIVVAAETERLTALVTLYQKQCSNATGTRPRTAYLHLSTDSPTEDEWDESQDEDPASPCVPARFVAIQELLRLVATDLQPLAIINDFFTADLPLFDRPLPTLRELTLVRNAAPSTLIPRGSTICPLFPALTHLHVVAQKSSPSQPLLPGWIAHAPRVTHLRVSAHPRMYKLLKELPAALGTPAKRRFAAGVAVPAESHPPARTYPSLVRVVVEPGSPPVKGACGTSRMAYSARKMELCMIAFQARERGVEMHVPRPKVKEEDSEDEDEDGDGEEE